MTKTCRRRWREHLPTIAQNYADAFEEFERVRKENETLRDTVEQLRRRVAQMEQERDE